MCGIIVMADPIKCIIFDFDGTLVGGMSIWIRVLRHTLSHFGVKATSSELRKEFRSCFINGIPGSPWRKIFRRRCPDREGEAWSLLFQTLEQAMDDVALSPNFSRFLETARSRGVKMGIITFRSRESVRKMLSKMDACSLFDVIIGSGDTSEEKPSPQPFLVASERMNVTPDECLVIGDEPADIIGGNRAGMRTVGVLSGVSNRDMLKKVGARMIVGSIEELANIPINLNQKEASDCDTSSGL